MIKVVIVDDEPFCVEVLEEMILANFPTIEIVGKANNGEDAIQAILNTDPDLVFMDIEMPSMDGFDILDKLLPFRFNVVFTTAHEEFAIQAFKVNALDYILKPFSAEDIRSALKSYLDFRSQSNVGNKVNRISISSSEGITLLAPTSILYIEADNSYSIFYLKDGKKHIVSKSLKYFERILDTSQFCRIHNSFLVNVDSIEKYMRSDNSLFLEDGTSLPIGRMFKDQFIDFFTRTFK